jgi:AAA+ ATPase superfamily predicted ATPase
LNRNDEIGLLRKSLDRDAPSLIIIYGRRRCGKSRLVKQVLKPGDVYFQADRQDSILQREVLVRTVSETLEIPYEAGFRNWESLFLDLNRVLKPNQTLVMDEFPYILKNDPALPSILQRLIDGKKLNYHLILCGSSQNVMSEMVKNGQEPLYGRASVVLNLKPLSPGWIRDALQLDDEESIREYAIWGGVPRYWELRQEYNNLESALLNLVFKRDAILLDEPMRILLDDLRSAVQPYTILTLIGQGVHRPSEIAARLEKGMSVISEALQKLLNLGIIRREIPYGESIRSSKRTLYKINDPYISFYFRFVLPNKQRIDAGLGNQVLARTMLYLDEYVSEQWEHLCRLAIPFLNINGIQWDLAHRWWGTGKNKKEMEIDCISKSFDKKKILLAEAKWSKKPNARNALNQLNECLLNIRGLSCDNYKIVKVLFFRKPVEITNDFQIILPAEVLEVLH